MTSRLTAFGLFSLLSISVTACNATVNFTTIPDLGTDSGDAGEGATDGGVLDMTSVPDADALDANLPDAAPLADGGTDAVVEQDAAIDGSVIVADAGVDARAGDAFVVADAAPDAAAPMAMLSLSESSTSIHVLEDLTVIVTNTSAVLATNVSVTLSPAFDGAAVLSANTCTGVALAPASSCSFTVDAQDVVVDASFIYVTSSNATTVGLSLAIEGYAVGDMHLGGVVYEVTDRGAHGKVSTTTNAGPLSYGGSGTTTGATSYTDGATNTTAIVTAVGSGSYAAAYCDTHEEIVGDVTYDDWYLPASDELTTLYAAIMPDTSGAAMWSSTETSSTMAMLRLPGGPGAFAGAKAVTALVRCVHAF